MAAVERQAEIVWEGGLVKGNGSLTVESGAFQDQGVTFPRRGGDPEGHTSPEELIASAHAACYAMSLAARLGRDDHTPEQLTITAVCGLDRNESGPYLSEIRLTAKGRVPGIDAAAFEQAAKDAKEACPVSKALNGNLEITLEAELEG